MNSCWLKLCLLLLYLLAIVLLSVVIDVIRLYQCSWVACHTATGNSSRNSERNVISHLNVATLEEILHQRGIQLPQSQQLQIENHHHNPHRSQQNHQNRPTSHLYETDWRTTAVRKSNHNEDVTHARRGFNDRAFPSYKDTLVDLVQKTGAIHVDEVLDIVNSGGSQATRSDLRSYRGFIGESLRSGSELEQLIIERANDIGSSLCLLVLIRLRGGVTLLQNSSWHELVHTVTRFGINAAVFDCASDPATCERRNWIVPQLVLALPGGPASALSTNGSARPKTAALNEVVWHTLYNLHQTRQVIGWIAKQLATNIQRIYPADLLSWKRFTQRENGSSKTKLKVLLVSDTSQAPILLSAIALRFRDRLDVGLIHPASLNTTFLSGTTFVDRSTSTYLILTPGSSSSNSFSVYVYGRERGEALNFQRLEIFLKFRLPEGQDLFALSLTFVNLLLCIELFIIESSCCAKHVISWLWRVAKYNAALVVVWLTAAAAVQFKWMDWLGDRAFSIVVQGYLCDSNLGHLLIAHWPFISSTQTLAISVFVFGSAVGLFSWHFISVLPPQQSGQTQNNEENRSQRGSLARPLLQISPYSRHRTRLSWIERTNQHSLVLINHFLWPLQPAAIQRIPQHAYRSMAITQNNLDESLLHCPLDYINHLPSWRFTYNCSDSVAGRVLQLSEASPDENYESILLEYTKFPSGIIPSLVCSICLERYRAASAMPWERCYRKPTTNSKRGIKNTDVAFSQLHEEQLHFQNGGDGGDVLCGLPCGHNFHAHCVQAWLARDQYASCPICRWPCYKQKEQSPKKSPDSCEEWDLGSPV